MRKIGFSINPSKSALLSTNLEKAIDIYCSCGQEAIEINFDKEEIDGLDKIIPKVKSFSYKSLHLPIIKYRPSGQIEEFLQRIAKFYNDIKAELALVHSDEVADWTVFEPFPFNWAVENMDKNKQAFKRPDDFKQFFASHKNWRLVLDLNHCYSNDSSMRLAQGFIDNFSDRIAEFHVSGYKFLHEPLYKTKQLEILKYCRGFDAPVIIESILESVDEIVKEYNYVKEFID